MPSLEAGAAVLEAASAVHTMVREAPAECEEAPRWFDTYALTYAVGMVWLAVSMVVLGGSRLYAFDGLYDFLLTLPPLATALCVVLIDRRGSWRWLPVRALLLATVAGVVSVLSTVLLTPLLALMFRERVGWNLPVAGLVSLVSLVAVASPVAVGLVTSAVRGSYGRALALAAGLAVAAVAVAMAAAPGGAVASMMRLDQAEITMIVSSWWLPFYAAAAAYARRLGIA